MSLTFVLGGARSGKSDLALRLAAASGRPVLFIATMEPRDDEVRARIDAHRAARPARWRTIEAPLDPVGALRTDARPGDFAIVDCLTLWVSNLLLGQPGADDGADTAARDAALEHVVAQAEGFACAAASFDGDVCAVSNEVGHGVVPPYPLGRLFRDALGAANRIVAARADRVLYCVAGMALDLRALGSAHVDSFGPVDA